jgi:hypothetical protein
MLRVAAQSLGALGRAAPLAARPALVPLVRHYADDANLAKTALYDFHIANGAKMVREQLHRRHFANARRSTRPCAAAVSCRAR